MEHITKQQWKRITRTGTICIGVLVFAFLVVLSAKEVRAAEPLYYCLTNGDGVEKITTYQYGRMEELHSDAPVLTDGYQEVVMDQSRRFYRYCATEDVDISLWLTDFTGDYIYYRLEAAWSGLYSSRNRYRSEDEGKTMDLFLKKGETIYVTLDAFSSHGGSCTLNVSIQKAKDIQSISVVSSKDEGYIQEKAYFNIPSIATWAVVEVTYVDGTKKKLRVAHDFSWTTDMQPDSYETGTYPYTIYYRGYPVSFTYTLKSFADTIPLTPVKAKMDIEVPYNNGDYVGYLFVPEKTGMYNIYCDDLYIKWPGDMLLYETDGRTLIDHDNWSDIFKELYLLEGVEYQIYAKKHDAEDMATFWIEEALQYVEEGLEVTSVERQWYTGEAVCPEPKLTYKGTNLEDLGFVTYTYARNRKPGMALVILDYTFSTKDDNEKIEGTVWVPFVIRGNMETAQIEIPNCTYTGKAIEPQEKVSFGGKVLTRGTDYTVEYSDNVNAGTAVAVIKGVGNYEGTVSRTFIIEKAPQEIRVKNVITTYKGAKSFSLKAKAKGKISYSGGKKKVAKINKKGNIIVKGYGKTNVTVKASATKNYLAASKKVSVVVTSKPTTFQSVKSKSKKKMTVKVKKVVGAHGYEISYSTDKKFKKNVKTKEMKSRTKTFKNLKSKTTYYVRVRTYRKVKGKKLYSGYSPVWNVKVK